MCRPFSPLGYLHSVTLDGGLVKSHWVRGRPSALPSSERDLDLVAIGGGEIIHDHDAYYGFWYDIPTSEAERLRPSRFFIEGFGDKPNGGRLSRGTRSAYRSTSR